MVNAVLDQIARQFRGDEFSHARSSMTVVGRMLRHDRSTE